MRISHIQTIPVDRYLFVQVHTDAGIVGLGEVGTWGFLEAAEQVVNKFAQYLVGQDPLRIEHHWQHLYRMGPFRGSVLGGAISAQVLNEFVNVMRRKHQRSWRDVENALAVILDRFPDVAPLTLATNADAVALARDHGLAFYDALIVAAALEAGCARLYSEDFQHGRRFGDLAIVDPFKESAAR